MLIRVSFALLLLAGWCAGHADPCPDYLPERRAYFGDLHVHTAFSLDASTQGTLTTPDQAYRFAQGERLPIQPWVDGVAQRSLQIDRPLDFAMVSDHAELFGEVQICSNPAHPEHDAWQCRMYRGWPRAAYIWFNLWSSQYADRVGLCGDDGQTCLDAAAGPWDVTRKAAAQHLQRCRFTTFVGYEWTGGHVGDASGNIHRNVVFSGDNVLQRPVSFIDEPDAYALMRRLSDQCLGGDGCDAVVIPHNSNLSAGLMFQAPATAEQAALRHRYERLAEIMQHKGASECHYDPLSSTDELCAFEQLPERSWTSSEPPRPGDGFLREVLKEGLALAPSLSTNPFQFGFVGSSDTHLGAPGAVEEGVFLGHGGAGKPARNTLPVGLPDHLAYNPGALAVLWAEENTRDALFAAMKRREAYATSGPRIQARFFAGDDIAPNACATNPAQAGYAGGVPMGGEVFEASAPVFLAHAQQDAAGGGLDRIQIVKGWVGADGETVEAVHDVAVSATRGELDVATCRVRGRGAAELCTTWTDPDFDPALPAYYYARVLEEPSCRWSQRMCVAAGVRCDDPATVTEGFEGCCDAAHQPQIQERAWTSPIWLTPRPETQRTP